jgi:hypothetical protein
MAKIDKEKYKSSRKYFIMTRKDLQPLAKAGDKVAEAELKRRSQRQKKKEKKKL